VTARAAPEAAAALADFECDLALMRDDVAPAGLKTVRLGVVTYEVFASKGVDWRTAPLAAATTERGVWPFISQLGRPVVSCDTFPQVAAAVRSGRVAGVLPSYARDELPAAEYRRVPEKGLDGASTPLLLAWRSKLDAVQPELTPARRALEQLVRKRL
jgi:DNA-binding transcriptional LysR family regulator